MNFRSASTKPLSGSLFPFRRTISSCKNFEGFWPDKINRFKTSSAGRQNRLRPENRGDFTSSCPRSQPAPIRTQYFLQTDSVIFQSLRFGSSRMPRISSAESQPLPPGRCTRRFFSFIKKATSTATKDFSCGWPFSPSRSLQTFKRGIKAHLAMMRFSKRGIFWPTTPCQSVAPPSRSLNFCRSSGL